MIKKLLFAHVILEIVGGLVLLFRPDMLMLTEPLKATSAALIKLFATLIFTFGLASLLLYRKFDYNAWSKMFVLLVMGYHFAQGLQCYSLYNTEVLANIGACSVHIGLALLLLVAFMNEREQFPT